MKYTPSKIEKKWQKCWEEHKTFKDYSRKEKFYALDMFPYPSGAGLHVGHPKGYIATDVSARFEQLRGKSVLHPMGWDAFGLPAENYAIKNKVHPSVAVKENIKRFKDQLRSIGFTYDWDREITTTDPAYYRWTQWIFLKMFERGLAYESYEPINWCPSCKTGLANEDLENGKCERCGSEVEQKPMRQWVLKMTDYADRLLADLDTENLDWEKSIVDQQKNWIGRSEGTTVKFKIKNEKLKIEGRKDGSLEGSIDTPIEDSIEVFTTRVDTIFGCTYVVIAPEHPILENLSSCHSREGGNPGICISNIDEVRKYIEQAKKKTTLQRTDLAKEKTGVKLEGVEAVNPFNGEEVPVFVADYVLGSYGTGAVMAVPAHDERDLEFAKKYDLPIWESITQITGTPKENANKRKVVYGIIENENGEILMQYLHKLNRYVLPGGGIEFNESEVEGLLREIIEETGYVDLQVGDKVGSVNANFVGLNGHDRVNETAVYKVRLLSHKQQDVCWDDKEIEIGMSHEWIVPEEALSKIRKDRIGECVFGELMRRYVEKDFCFTNDGILTNSGEFTGLSSAEAREKMTEWLEKTGNGKRTVNYKMRDWVFSRQRYWGEPIPIVHCGRCAACDTETKIEIHFRNDVIWGALVSGKKTIETRALNPEESERYFGDVRTGDVIRCINKNSNEERVCRVSEVFVFKNLRELFDQKTLLPNICSGDIPNSLEELKERYASLSPEYLRKIEKNGLVAWRLERVTRAVPVPETELPVVLPEVEHYEPTGTGEGPLAAIEDWVNTVCPKCGGPAKRETNTMPQWAGSSWYYLAYVMRDNSKFKIQNSKLFSEWLPVDLYVGGAEHATRHLLYARFWHKFLYDLGVVSTKEPFRRLVHVGLINAEDGRKMSKRWNNVINPDDVIAEFGADSLRLYEMFMGPFTQSIAWNTEGVSGVRRFLDKVWRLQEKLATNDQRPTTESREVETLLHKTIKKVTEDIEAFRFNTAISSLMILVNRLDSQTYNLQPTTYKLLILLLSPFAPHIAEELWEKMGHTTSIFLEKWPEYDAKRIVDEKITLIVQVNGKVRDRLEVPADISESDAKDKALASENVQKFTQGKEIRKVIFVKGKLVNIVAGN